MSKDYINDYPYYLVAYGSRPGSGRGDEIVGGYYGRDWDNMIEMGAEWANDMPQWIIMLVDLEDA